MAGSVRLSTFHRVQAPGNVLICTECTTLLLRNIVSPDSKPRLESCPHVFAGPPVVPFLVRISVLETHEGPSTFRGPSEMKLGPRHAQIT